MVWKIKGKGSEIIEVWEDYYGNLWFVTEDEGDGNKFGYVRLYSMPEMAEWGCFNIEQIKGEIGKNMMWPVVKDNWGNINTYEKGLLVEVD